MTPLEEFLNILAETADKNCDLDSKISLEELPAEGGIYAELGEGFAAAQSFDRTELKTVPVLFLCRNADQRRCLEQLESICGYFTRLQTYPQGSSFIWKNAETAKCPSKIGRDEDGVYHYSCILNCKIFY